MTREAAMGFTGKACRGRISLERRGKERTRAFVRYHSKTAPTGRLSSRCDPAWSTDWDEGGKEHGTVFRAENLKYLECTSKGDGGGGIGA